MQLLRGMGWVCGRSAMSHGPVDIFAAKSGRILLIQVKSGSARAKKIELQMLKKWAVAFDARAEVWSFKKGKLEKYIVRAKPRKVQVATAHSKDIVLSDEKKPQLIQTETELTITSAEIDLPKILPA
ncbi:MAG: hypothetical protein ACYC7D_08165 [Nitrososphaerales archaeon]